MILPITVYGDPILRKISEPIDQNYENLDQVIDNMWETMYHADGVGLAAPQIGLSIRIFVIDGSSMAEEEPELENFKITFINAEILERTGEVVPFNEGCLSLPQIREDVNRPSKVRIRYLDRNWVQHEEEYTGFAARVIQHEYDHLDGKLFIDHLSLIRRKLLKSKLTAISLGKIKVSYRIKLPKK
ncbi:MAG: peptide deformylase [Bacteroidota bacterium]|nr:peptide deformylase [Bacteroidota bacterium]